MTRFPHTCPKVPVVNMVRFRDRRGYLVAVATAALLAVAQVTAEGSECVNNCVAISECPEMVALLKTGDIHSIRSATCGITSLGPKVCCPSTTTPVPPTTPPAPPTIPPAPPTTPPAPPTTPPAPPTTPPAPPTTPPAPRQLGSLMRDCGKSQHDKAVLGGAYAPIDAYPWRAILGYHSTDGTDVQWNCGGSIINDRYILTAAHCVNPGFLKRRDVTLVTVRLGEWDLNKTEDCMLLWCNPPVQDFGIEEVTEHPDFDNIQTTTNDIALIRLNRSINFPSNGALAAVCLPPSEFNPSQALLNRGAIIAGWGLTEKGFQSPFLREARLPFVPDKCTKVYGNRLIASQICVGGEAAQDSCLGDSGGPLVMEGPGRGSRYLQVGIVSFRPAACGLEGVPGIYTSTRHYRKWIEENIFV